MLCSDNFKTSCYKVCGRSNRNAPDVFGRQLLQTLAGALPIVRYRGFLNRYRQIPGYYLN